VNRMGAVAFLVALSLGQIACNSNSQPSQATTNTQPSSEKTGNAKVSQPGVATGSYSAKGETVDLKYAYAGKAIRFGEESIVVLLTDKPIPPEAVAEEIRSQKMLLAEQIRGLEYAIDDKGYWVRYHPSQYQESKAGKPMEFSVENDTVKGKDEDDGSFTEGKYSRSVTFEAKLIK
jgi:hypothetical protein